MHPQEEVLRVGMDTHQDHSITADRHLHIIVEEITHQVHHGHPADHHTAVVAVHIQEEDHHQEAVMLRVAEEVDQPQVVAGEVRQKF